ncbi:HPr family phosphocarrier protein [Halanaerobium sp. Z-7514]|uniref:Phosphocarrier protein HPr n=1 Tax=Halanaerobium polyolivorans TaxID=2886943 RepID=A0AAW4X1V8_9FIRM|nr:HPr family phosphocarrier protein [Halanaerobium polyolivorans]MCC3145804.1 HPr family phosphocarrier protein [Halanaerobium polyolivorans]
MLHQKSVEVKNRTGLHARPAAQLVEMAGKYDSKINIVHENKEVNAKSIMGVMSLGLVRGSTFTIKAEGEDAKEAVNELVSFVEVELMKEDEE